MAQPEKEKKSVTQAVWELAQPLAEQLGLELWDVRFVKEGSDWFLRIFIDRPQGVSLDDCTAMSQAIDAPLDALDPISQSYSLEVCSPGINRQLTRPAHFEAFSGAPVRVRLIRPRADGSRSLSGTLEERTPTGAVLLRLDDETICTVEKQEIAGVFVAEEDDFFEPD